MSLAISARGNVYAAITVAHADPPANLQTHRRRIMYTYIYIYIYICIYFTASYVFILSQARKVERGESAVRYARASRH